MSKVNYALIHVIFPIYEERFYHYLIPWVVDDLRDKEIKTKYGSKVVSQYFNLISTDSLDVEKVINASIKR